MSEEIEIGALFMATAIGMQTLVGVGRDKRPQDSGNCFSIFIEPVTRSDILSGQAKEYQILNFNVENLEALIKAGLTWPIQCKKLDARHAIIHDPRIGERWYSKRYCEVCTPKDLLPITQRQVHEREIMRGDRKESAGFITINLGGTRAEFP